MSDLLDTAPVPTHTLYSPGQVAWASFLGAPIAGSLLMGANYSKSGQPRLARKAIGLGIVATIVVLVIAYFLPDKFPNSVLPAAYVFAMFSIARSQQGNLVERHLSAGGPKASSWVATGIGVLCLVVLLAIIFAFVFVGIEMFPERFAED